VAILQNCVDILRGEHDLCTETCSTSSAEGNQFLFVNVDEVTGIKQEDDPEVTTSPVIRAEPAVSLKSACFHRYTRCIKSQKCFCLPYLLHMNIPCHILINIYIWILIYRLYPYYEISCGFNNNNNIYLTAVGLSPGGSGF
jgi:hypothetical protein